MTLEQIMKKDKEIEKVLLDPTVEDSLRFARAVAALKMIEIKEKYKDNGLYEEELDKFLNDLDKVIFLIKQLKEGFIK